MYKNFIKHTLITAISLLLVFVTVIVVVDPFLHYHKPIQGLEPVAEDERYQNPGIAKQFSYDSVLIGSSMTQNFRVSELNEAFQCDTIKLTYSAIRTGNYKHMFERAFAHGDVKNVFMGLDIDPLIDTYGNYYFPLPEYLYDDNILNDVNYVLNKTVLFEDTYQYLKKNYQGTVPDIDEAYMWEGSFSKEDALGSIWWEVTEKGVPAEQPSCLENTKLNLGNNILPYIEAHPETTFYIFYPPYSLLWWNLQLNEGDLGSVIDVVKYTSKELLKYDNVKLYSFQDVEEVVTDLEIYKDYNHYGPETNSQIVEWFKNDEYRLEQDTYEERISRFQEYVENFDYGAWVSEV